MQLLVWEDRFSVGIREFDQHHKILFEMINTLIIARDNRSDHAVIKRTLDQLVQYTIFHFTAEESLMRHFGFDGLPEHEREHADLLKQVQVYQEKVIKKDAISLDELLNFLADWLLNHTLGIDQEYGPFLSHYTD
ncbi:MAG: bacteriohemerythrin [Candidatus Marinimicrobia bacterium]|nr:bacteriohemerythrin [Candidatus Neomarinimicrobiota bacterium]